MNQEQAERIAAAIDARAEELTIEEAAREKAGVNKAGTVGSRFAMGVIVLLSAAGLAVVGLILYAAVRGIGSWLEVW